MDKRSCQAGPDAQRLSRRRAVMAGAGVSTTALLLACGNKSGRTAKTGSAAPGRAAKPKYGGALQVSIMSDFSTFDPSIDAKSINQYSQTLAYDSLLTFKSGPGVDYNDTTLEPKLAERWETPDAQTYVFHVRKNVKFANLPPVNGRSLTSADVKWALEYQSRTGSFATTKLPASDLGYMFEGMNAIETPDDATATVRFAAPFAPFLNYASSVGTVIMPRELLDQQGAFATNMAGTGAFQLDPASSQHGARWVFKKNANYWDAGKPYLDAVNHLVIPDSVTQYSAFKARQLDIVSVTDVGVVDQMKKSNPDAGTQDHGVQQLGLYINNSRSSLADERVRRAVSMAIDRSEFDRVFAAGKGGLPMLGTLPGTFTQQESAQILKLDPAAAKSLLQAAGFPSGIQLELMTSGQTYAPQAQLLQGHLKQAGIDMAIKVLDFATWAQRLHKSDFDLSLSPFAVVGDVDSKLYGNFDSKSTGDYVSAKDPAYDKLAEAQRQEVDPAKRRDAIRQASRYIEEHAMSTALYLQVGTTFWQPYVKNYADHWQEYDWLAPQVWVEK